MALPPLPAIGRARIEIFGPAPGSAKWGEALWGISTWPGLGWNDITPQSMVATVTWGADDPAGVLTVPAAGSWTVNTYDPERILDPSNGQSPYATTIRPGKPIRLAYVNESGTHRVVRQGLIDEVKYDLVTAKGSLRGTDQVQLMVGAHLPEGQHTDPLMPTTLRARAQYVINKAGLGSLVKVMLVDELIYNGDFELGLTGWATIGNVRITPTRAGGGNVCHITGDTGFPQIQGQALPLTGGVTYRLSCWGRATGATGDCRLDDAGGVTASFLHFDAGPDWVYKETNFVPPADGMYHILAYNAAGPVGSIVEYDNISFGEVLTDPPVGKVQEREATVWNIILTAAYDALYATWMDRYGTLRFRSFGNPRDTGFQAGGVDGIAISNMETDASLQNVFTRISTFDIAVSPGQPVVAFDATKASIYGDILLHRDQPVPNARAWVDSILADRAGASLQYSPGTLYPQTEDALESILDLGMVDIAHLVVESVTPSIDVAARVLGGTITADTDTGWTAHLSSYIPAKEWEEADTPPPVIPPEPPSTTQVVRTYNCTADARLAHSSSLDAGNGTDVQLPIGYISPYRNRAVLDFTDIPFSGVVRVVKAELVVKIGTNSCGAFGSEPKVNVSRITGSWSEGSYSASCGFGTSNSVKYPGPSVTSSGSVTTTVPKGTGTEKAIDITAIAEAWRSGQAQRGVMVKSAGEDTSKYTTCFYSRHHGTSGNRPFLRLTLEVAA